MLKSGFSCVDNLPRSAVVLGTIRAVVLGTIRAVALARSAPPTTIHADLGAAEFIPGHGEEPGIKEHT